MEKQEKYCVDTLSYLELCKTSEINKSKGTNSHIKMFTSFSFWANHTCHKLWTKICEIRQNFKEDLTNFCEIILNINLELPQYSLKLFFFYVKSLWKPQQYVIYVYFFIKSVVKWSENFVRFEFFMEIAFQISQILWVLSHSVRLGMCG